MRRESCVSGLRGGGEVLGTDVDCEGALGNYFGLVKKQPTRAHFHPSSVGTATAQTGLRTALRESWSAKSPGIGQNDLTLFLVPVRTSSLILRQRKVQSSTNTLYYTHPSKQGKAVDPATSQTCEICWHSLVATYVPYLINKPTGVQSKRYSFCYCKSNKIAVKFNHYGVQQASLLRACFARARDFRLRS